MSKINLFTFIFLHLCYLWYLWLALDFVRLFYHPYRCYLKH